MEGELLKKLVNEPENLPFFLILAFVTILVLKIFNVFSDFLIKKFSEKIKNRKSIFSFSKIMIQIIMMTLVFYVANAVYWSHTLEKIILSSTEKPISTCESTVELTVISDSTDEAHFIDSGGYLAFGKGDKALLITSSSDSWGKPISNNRYLYRGIFKMDATDLSVGKPINILSQADYVQVEFPIMSNEFKLESGKAICIINSEIRLEIVFPPQITKNRKVYLRDLATIRDKLK